MGTPVEIEFAVNLPHPANTLNKPELNLLQVKPLTGKQRAYELNDSVLDPESILLYSQTALGNGLIDTVTDLIMVDLSVFDRTRTSEIANEVEWFNRRFLKENRHYLLIGPGRWGTRDKVWEYQSPGHKSVMPKSLSNWDSKIIILMHH
jgi:hypothetical protein